MQRKPFMLFSRNKLPKLPELTLDEVITLVPDNLPLFSQYYLQMTYQERQHVAKQVGARITNIPDAMRIIGHYHTMVISAKNIHTIIRDTAGLSQTEHGSYIVENFPVGVVEACVCRVNEYPQERDSYNQSVLREASRRAVIKK